MIPLTLDEIQAEMNYRYTERLSLLCQDGIPSAVEKTMASADANEWLRCFQAAQVAVESKSIAPFGE